ncbi:MAG: PEP-CTERM sorting domain-containing protein [Proteobacteria bacterium]|nr:PEP-CTERM sorting domain-containing protein [Pseudomonadota bacterium]
MNANLDNGYNWQFSYGVNDPGASDGNNRRISTLDNNDSSHQWQSVGAYETFTISSAAVPAPATMMLFGLGLFGIGSRCRTCKLKR